MRSRLLKILICLIMIISYIPITAISVESGESVVDGSTAGAPIAVPEEGLAISGGTLYGIDKTWFANVNPDKAIKNYMMQSHIWMGWGVSVLQLLVLMMQLDLKQLVSRLCRGTAN